jgi:uncharacterized protein
MFEFTSKYLAYYLLGLAHGSRIYSALDSFICDTVKILILLAVIILVIYFVRGFFPPGKNQEDPFTLKGVYR